MTDLTQQQQARWGSLNTNQQQVIQAAYDLVNGGQDMEEALSCYKTITQYVINSTYNEPTTTSD
jgi:hypothetical protein